MRTERVGYDEENVDSEAKVQYNRGRSGNNRKKSRVVKYIPYDKIGTPNISYIRSELSKIFDGVEDGIADGIAIERGSTVYIVDAGKGSEGISFGVRGIRVFTDSRLREECIRRINDDAVSKGYISDGLSSRFKYRYDSGRSSHIGSESGEELSADKRKSSDNQRGISEDNGNKGVRLNSKIQHSYAGKKSVAADMSLLERAEQMEADGAESEAIRRETGWFKSFDGQWRFEIDDSKMRYLNPTLDAEGFTTLGELIENEALFEAYPQLRDLKVEVKADTKYNYYSPRLKKIVLMERVFENGDFAKIVEKTQSGRATLIHEIQHAIQHIEGFARGSSPSEWRGVIRERRKKVGSGIKEHTDRTVAWLAEKYGEEIGQDTERYIELVLLDWKNKLKKSELEELDYLEVGLEMKLGEDFERIENSLIAEAKWIRSVKSIKGEAELSYYNTAGEIEAYDVGDRVDLDAEVRRAVRPDIDRNPDDVKFADPTSWRKMHGEDVEKNEETRYLSAKTNDDILSLVDKVSNGNFDPHEKVYLGDVHSSLISTIKKLTGIDTSGFKIFIEARQIDHILKQHGKNGKSDKTMSDHSNIAKIEYALNEYDDISRGKTTNAYKNFVDGKTQGAQTILYEKYIGEKSLYVVQAVPDTKSKTLYIVSAFIGKKGYKKEASQFANEKNLGATSEIGTANTSNNSISQFLKKINTFKQKNKIQYSRKSSDNSGGNAVSGAELMRRLDIGSDLSLRP